MSLNPRFCSQCSGTVEERLIEDRVRVVCQSCGMIFYKNPLPIAAAVVLNPRREVLLVKRRNDPRKGFWCLPIGFAETGESIGDAALRELGEEASITGNIVRLLDASSMIMDIYGDVLVVTFEVVKTGGEEKAGDDAEDVGYFSMESLPPMAFEPNERAVRNCLKEHYFEWAIQDSFHRLELEQGGNLLSDSLVLFTWENAQVLTNHWYESVSGNPLTPSYSIVESGYLKRRTMTELTHFSDWLMDPQCREEMKIFYMKLGEERKAMGFGLHEVVSAMTILRKIVLSHAHRHGVWENAIDAYRVLELDHRIMHFFDDAMYFVARGYEEG